MYARRLPREPMSGTSPSAGTVGQGRKRPGIRSAFGFRENLPDQSRTSRENGISRSGWLASRRFEAVPRGCTFLAEPGQSRKKSPMRLPPQGLNADTLSL